MGICEMLQYYYVVLWRIKLQTQNVKNKTVCPTCSIYLFYLGP